MTPTALHAGLVACEACAQLNARRRLSRPGTCERCGATLHTRKPDSLSRCWALLLAGYILYIPANLLPVIETGSLFGSQVDTIFSGVVFLWRDGDWPLALLIFFASIFVPLAKLLSLTFLLVSVRLRSRWRPRLRTRLYRILEYVGRWSMVDIYVAAVLVALVQFKAIATIHAGPGAIAFGAVVVITMFAAMSFDARLIWDPLDETTPHEHA